MAASFEAPLQVPATAEVRVRIKIIADREHISQAEVVRQLIDLSLQRREQVSEFLHP